MLNEIIELEQYTSSPKLFINGGIQPRLKFNTLLPQSKTDHGRSGMTRAMTIIARSFIFGKDGEKDYKKLFNNKGVFRDEKVIDVLKAWCGLEYTEENDLFESNWFKLYIRYALFKKELDEIVKDESLKITNENPIDIIVERFVKLKKYLELTGEISDLKDKKRASKKKKELNDKLESCQKSIDFLASADFEKFETEARKEFMKLERIINYFKNEKFKRLNKIIEFLIDYEETFNPPKIIFPKPGKLKAVKPKKGKKDKKNDLKAIKFKNIIANALNEGPLHRYYLVCNSDPMDCVRKKDSNTPIGKHAKKSKDSDVRNNARDRILKATASYLLKRKINPEQEYVYFNRQDLINWLATDNLKSNLLTSYKFVTPNKDNNNPIFEFIRITENLTKMKVNPLWLDTFKFELVEEHDFDKAKLQGKTFYRDQGSGKYLEEGKKYE